MGRADARTQCDHLRSTGGVGLFGAIEVAHHNGPFFQEQTYTVNAHVVAVSESPKTESLWFDSTAHDAEGRLSRHNA